MRILMVGDVVGKRGREAVLEQVPSLREQHAVDFVIVNAENGPAVGTVVRSATRAVIMWPSALHPRLSPVVKKAFDLSQESEKTKDRYGRNRPGQSVLLARRLVEAGCRFVTAAGYKANQWDTHGSNDKRLREDLGPILDQSLSALMEDLDQRGLLQTTVVIVAGEFGRTAVVNQNAGRDHWPDCWSLLLGGGGIQGGHIIGASDKDGAYVADRPVSLGDLYATVYKALGVDWTKTYNSPIGRPVYIANGFGDTVGSPLEELV